MYRMLWPRHAVLQECSRRLSSQLVTRWMNKDARAFAETIQPVDSRTLGNARHEAGGIDRTISGPCRGSRCRQKPETLLAEILAVMQTLLGGNHESAKSKDPRMTINFTPVVQAMESLEKVIGIPDECRSAKQAHVEPSMIERSLEEIAHVIADECEQKLAELAVTLLEDPNYRLAGAEEALRQFCTTVEQALKSQETLAKELGENAAQLHQRIQKLIDTSVESKAPTSTQWTLNVRHSAVAAAGLGPNDIFELVRTYTKTRYHSLVLTHLNRLYVSLRGHLSDQIREVGFCRARLGELQTLLPAYSRSGPKE